MHHGLSQPCQPKPKPSGLATLGAYPMPTAIELRYALPCLASRANLIIGCPANSSSGISAPLHFCPIALAEILRCGLALPSRFSPAFSLALANYQPESGRKKQ
jgi:hypothetical protein